MDKAKLFSCDLFYIFVGAHISLQIIDLSRPALFFFDLFRQFRLLDLIFLSLRPKLKSIH